MIHHSRVRTLNTASIAQSGRFVLYWVQQSQRSRFNHALEYAIGQANELRQPLLVCFGLMDDYPEANLRHYAFMLQGLADVSKQLAKRGIKLLVMHGNPSDVALHYAKHASLVVCDRGYLRHQKRWRDQVADHARCRVAQVESDVVVSVEVASDKAEFAARTIRPKIHKHLSDYLKPLQPRRLQRASLDLDIEGNIALDDTDAVLRKLKLDRSVPVATRFLGGETEAKKRLNRFISERLSTYDESRNEPSATATSFMSPYLHFGQISPLEIALAVKQSSAPTKDKEAYLEELVVRRELAMNFVHYVPKYDSFDAVPAWAQRTLARHGSDPRGTNYSLHQLESAQTQDRWWNAAQREMIQTGFMHNYMRMYWGKKILEWSKSPKQAYETALHLNNKYFLDGRDPVSYANVGWIFGLHDRPWIERPVFGQVRYMNAAGLERKFDMDAYIKQVEQL
jgi:deoxyribodipyrimidine photo-lyase